MKIGDRGDIAKFAEHLIIELGDPDQEVKPDEQKEARVLAKRIADIVKRNFGLTKITFLGMGAFGVAGRMENGRVFKLTTDDWEAELSYRLIGMKLPHVVQIHRVTLLKDIEISNWNVRRDLPVFAIVMDFVPGETLQNHPEAQELRNLIAEAGNLYEIDKVDVLDLPYQEAEKRAEGASKYLLQELERKPRPFADIAQALKELQAIGYYAVDVHPENVAWSPADGFWKVFDLGVPYRPDTLIPGISGLYVI